MPTSPPHDTTGNGQVLVGAGASLQVVDLTSASVTIEFEGVEGTLLAVACDEDKVIGW